MISHYKDICFLLKVFTVLFSCIKEVVSFNQKSIRVFCNLHYRVEITCNSMCYQLIGRPMVVYGHAGISFFSRNGGCNSIHLKNSYHTKYGLLIGFFLYFIHHYTICSSQYKSKLWSGINTNIVSFVVYWLSHSIEEIAAPFCQCVCYVQHKILFHLSQLLNFALQSIEKIDCDEQMVSYVYGAIPLYKYLICEEKRVNVTTYQSSNYSFAAQRA